MSVSVLVCETRPLPVYPIVFRHPRVASWQEIQQIKHLMCIKSEEEGPGEKKCLQYFEFGLQYLVQLLVNSTYSTFNFIE